MGRSWERYIAAEEAAHTSACYEHAKSFGIDDPLKYMEEHNIPSCEDMVCASKCPLNSKESTDERV